MTSWVRSLKRTFNFLLRFPYKRNKRLKICLSFVTFLFVLGAAGCRSEQIKSDGRPIVYTSFHPIYNLTQTVAGDEVDVRSFMPADKIVHKWEPTMKEMVALSEADLLIANGANAERWVPSVQDNFPDLKIVTLADEVELITYTGAAALGDFQYAAQLEPKSTSELLPIIFGHTHEDNMRVVFFNNEDGLTGDALLEKGRELMNDKGKKVEQKETFKVESGAVYDIQMGHQSGIVHYQLPTDGDWVFFSDRLSEEILSYQLLDDDEELMALEPLLEGSSHGMDSVTYDPHAWLSIHNAKRYLNGIQKALSDLAPESAPVFRKNRFNEVDQLTLVEAEYREKMKELTSREFIVMHYAYEYLARDFDLIQYPLQGLTSMDDPSLHTIKTAAIRAQESGIQTIFSEYGIEPRVEATLAEELGGEVLPLISFEFEVETESGEQMKYHEMMAYNLEQLYSGLKNEAND